MISKNRLILVKEQEFDYDVKVTSNVDTIEFLEKNNKATRRTRRSFYMYYFR